MPKKHNINKTKTNKHETHAGLELQLSCSQSIPQLFGFFHLKNSITMIVNRNMEPPIPLHYYFSFEDTKCTTEQPVYATNLEQNDTLLYRLVICS